MKKRISCLFLCLILLAAAVPAGTFSIASSAAGTTGGNSYVVGSFDELMTAFAYNTSASEPLNIKLSSNISKTITGTTQLATAGRDVILDLDGYTLSFTDKGSDPSTPINGKNGSITVTDSKRSGRIEYLYTLPDRGTQIMTGDIIVKNGTIVNKCHCATTGVNYNSVYTSSSTGGYIKMYGGTLEADYPIFLLNTRETAIYGGSLSIKQGAGILVWKAYANASFNENELPRIYDCNMYNSSSDATVHAYEVYVTNDYLKLYTMEHGLMTLRSMFGAGTVAYIDGVKQDSVTSNIKIGGTFSNILIGPYFKSGYQLVTPEVVDTFELTIDEPEPGELMPYLAHTPSGAGYASRTGFKSGGYVNGVQWTDGAQYTSVYDYGSKFEAGKKYTVFIMVIPVQPKYSFAAVDKISATINGKKALVYSDGDVYIVYRSFDVQLKTIDSIEITVTAPKVGVLPSYTASVTEGMGYAIQTSSLNNGVAWMDDKGVDLAGGYKFEKDKAYQVLVMIKLTDTQKYKFEDYSNINATINGRAANVIPYSAILYGVYYKFDLTNVISKLEITVPNTKAGAKAEWSASVPDGANYIVQNKNENYTANGVTWYNENGTVVAPGKVINFVAGKTYKVVINLEPADKDNYQFAASGDVTAKVNGTDATVTVLSDARCMVSYSFTAKKLIDRVDVIISEPKDGEPLSYVASVPYDVDYELYEYSSDPSVNLWKDGVAWVRNGSGQLIPGQTAIAGQSYTVYIKLRSKDKVNNPFDDLANMTATVNGKAAKILKNSENTYHVYYTFTVKKEYNRGDINGDGNVDATDAIILKKHMLKITVLSKEQEKRADLDGNEKIDTTDYIILKRILLGLEK